VFIKLSPDTENFDNTFIAHKRTYQTYRATPPTFLIWMWPGIPVAYQKLPESDCGYVTATPC